MQEKTFPVFLLKQLFDELWEDGFILHLSESELLYLLGIENTRFTFMPPPGFPPPLKS